MLVLDGGGERVLVFLPGFMSAAESYVEVLTPVADAGVTVLVPQLYRRGVGALAGRVPVSSEAAARVLLTGIFLSCRMRWCLWGVSVISCR